MSDQNGKLTPLRRAARKRKRGSAEELAEDGIRCSFCGAAKDEVERMFSGPSVSICNECIVACNRLLNK